ncbi:MAG: NAD(P)H-binding protein, partial [Methylobacteriaceae bacterium]|nr:NAD(P)H-binding protein [Methylobacteriaceae bacterium]
MKLFVFGLGYSALRYALSSGAASIAGTTRSEARIAALGARDVDGHVFDGHRAGPGLAAALAACDALLVSAPPDGDGDPALRVCGEAIAAAPVARIVYLSTIGVYGDRAGAWVDETSAPAPGNERSQDRLRAENDWLELAARTGKRVDVLRLSGIYGPGQNALVNLRQGVARRIVKKGQVFNRIHVDDIARAVA